MLYAVYFKGYWPVGAVALVEANSKPESIQKLCLHEAFRPFVDKNLTVDDFLVKKARLYNGVNILLDGDY